MLDLTSYLQGVEYSSFSFWFVRTVSGDFRIYDKSSHTYVCSMVELEFSNLDDETKRRINLDFERFKNRPEYSVGLQTNNNYSDVQDLYELKLIGCILISYWRAKIENDPENNVFDPEDHVSPAHRAIEWLRGTDFFTAPASTRYHGCEKSGLVKHSLDVANQIIQLIQLPKFSGVLLEDAVLVALVHDWCKIGFYDSYMRNVKDDSGKWVQKEEYKCRDVSLTSFGHGVSSMFLAQRFFRLSIDQCLAIRWHMGFCRVADSEMNELQQSNELYPIVHLLQFADQLSITKY